MAFRWQDADPEAPQQGPGGSTTPQSWQSVTPAPGSPAAELAADQNAPPPAGYVRQPDGTLRWGGYDPTTGAVKGMPTLIAGAGPTAGATTGDPLAQFQAYLAKYPGNPQAAIDAWNAAGDPGGLKPSYYAGNQTIGLANNSYLVAPGTGGNSGADWQTVQRQPGDTGQGSGADALGSLIAPFTEQFTNPAFQAPTSVDDTNDPGFSARMNAADDALQRSAAAKGSLLSGSTLKALSDYNSDYASNEYNQTYNRDLSTYNTNSQNAYQQYAQRRANFYQNQDSPFAKLFGLAQLDSSNTNAFNANQLGYASLGASTLTNPAYASYLTQGANATAAGQVGAGNAYAGLFGNLGNSGTLAYLASRQPSTTGYPGQYGAY